MEKFARVVDVDHAWVDVVDAVEFVWPNWYSFAYVRVVCSLSLDGAYLFFFLPPPYTRSHNALSTEASVFEPVLPAGATHVDLIDHLQLPDSLLTPERSLLPALVADGYLSRRALLISAPPRTPKASFLDDYQHRNGFSALLSAGISISPPIALQSPVNLTSRLHQDGSRFHDLVSVPIGGPPCAS